jgi:PEP-CTERM motif
MRLSSLLSLSALATLALSFGPSAHATTVTAGSTTTVASGGIAPGSASNYDFSDFGASGPTNLTNFTLNTDGTGQFPGNNLYSVVTAPDGSTDFTSGTTGTAYFGDNATHLMATFSPSFSGDFDVWLLTGNTDLGFVTDASIGIGFDGGPAVTVAVDSNALTTNNFTEFEITGATAGETFQVYATGSDGTNGYNFSETNLGGITFDANVAPVPEPASLALLGTGILGGLGLLRRKFLKA